MTKGRRPDPAELKALKAPAGAKRPENIVPEAQLRTLADEPPPWLKGMAAKIWAEIWPHLASSRMGRETDRPTLAIYCQDYADYIEAVLQLKHRGKIYTTTSAHTPIMYRLNPWEIIKDRANRRLNLREDKLGLSPAARGAIMARFAPGLPAPQANPDAAAQVPHNTPQLPGLDDVSPFGLATEASGGKSSVH